MHYFALMGNSLKPTHFSKALRNKGSAMRLVVTPVSTNLVYRVSFKEPWLELLKEEQRIPLISKFLEVFDLHLDDIILNEATPSRDYLHFSRFYGSAYLDVSFGLEEVLASLNTPQNEAQVTDLYGKLFQTFEQNSIPNQTMTIGQHLSTEEDAVSFLESLNPHCPSNFEKYLHGRGVYYTLKLPKNELTIYITLVNSLFVAGGLYLSIESQFSPNKHDFQNAFKIVKKSYDFILKELNLKMRGVS